MNNYDDTESKTNCYEKCQYYYFINELKEYSCTLNQNCPERYNMLIQEKSKCIDNCKNDNIYKYEYNNLCYENCPNNKISSFEDKYHCMDENDINNYKNKNINESVLENIKEYLLNNYNKTKNGVDIDVETKNVLVTVTNTFNQINNVDKNTTTINLGECEKNLLIIIIFPKMRHYIY